MKKTIILLTTAAIAFLASSCSTVQGLGEDVQKAGGAISKSATRAAN
jgi:predicted small secreted protein